MTTMFIDTNGEMSLADNERLKFIMHYLKQGADDSLVEMKDGRFVREDSELSFTEIWLPSAEHQQRKIDEQQAKVEELEQELESERAETIKGYSKISDLRLERDELQKRVGVVTHLIRGLRAEYDLWMDVECPQVETQIELLEQALKGEG